MNKAEQLQTQSHKPGQRIAVIGGGISGLTVAHLLSAQHQVVLFESNAYVGGHTHTRNVALSGRNYPVNTGFIVFNDWTYPNFIKLMDRLKVQSEASDMSFSVRCENTGLEYNGTNLNSLFAQRVNLVRPSFLRMVADILKFNKQTVALLQQGGVSDDQTLGDFLAQEGYSDSFLKYYVIPMGAAIWSASIDVMKGFPLRFFLQFFNNHGMLSVDDRPQWRVIKNGSSAYIDPLIEPFKKNIRLSAPVLKVNRSDTAVEVITESSRDYFDQVVFACHSDQALQMLGDPSAIENEVLGALPYQDNDVVLHTDTRLLPKRKRAWASWNYHIPQRSSDRAMVTYNMNMLQNFHDASETFLVTLNRNHEIAPDRIIECYQYSHPVFTEDGIKAQQKHHLISGMNRTHYAGAYWFNGFHEDGVNSALRVAQAFDRSLDGSCPDDQVKKRA